MMNFQILSALAHKAPLQICLVALHARESVSGKAGRQSQSLRRRFEKDTRHFEIDLTGWGLNYEVGDSMTVWPTNDPALVDEIINKIGAKGDEPVKGPTAIRLCAKRCCAIAASRKPRRNF